MHCRCRQQGHRLWQRDDFTFVVVDRFLDFGLNWRYDSGLVAGDLLHGDKYKWSLQLTAVNVTNKVALYNFLSTFTGTDFVTPRAFTMDLGFHF